MKKKLLFTTIAAVLTLAVGGLSSCGETPSTTSAPTTSQGTTVYENYYVIEPDGIRAEMLIGSSQLLNFKITNLGDPCEPNYSLKVELDGTDVTAETYDAASKTFTPKTVGSHKVTIVILGDDGQPYKTASGNSFSKVVNIDVVRQSFAPMNSDGPDVTVSQDGVITFGDQYKTSEKKLDSGQYKVTGVTFEGSYSITYVLQGLENCPNYPDDSLYFGWNKNWKSNYDDCFKLSIENGTMATWVWGSNGDLANLGINRNQGWSKGDWWDAPGNVNDGSVINGDHTITFQRFVNKELDRATYGIIFDNQPFTYLVIEKEYTDLLTNVWVESNNAKGSIYVESYSNIEDTTAPGLELNFNGDYTIGDSINLKAAAKVTDDSAYASILVPTFKVYDSEGEEQEVNSGVFTAPEVGEYKVVGTVTDLAGNVTTTEKTVKIKNLDKKNTIIDLSQTSALALPECGIILYASATNSGQEVAIDHFEAEKDGKDVTAETIHTYTAENDPNKTYTYFSGDTGVYTLYAYSIDGKFKSKDIDVNIKNTEIYTWTFWEMGTMQFRNKFAVGINTILYYNNQAGDKQCCKLSNSQVKGNMQNWKLDYDITDLSFASQGKLYITKSTLNAEGDMLGWEDLAIGGKPGENGQEFFGFECDVLGTGWTTYVWRSQPDAEKPTTEFMPDPNDRTKGCGRPVSEYNQYLTGTHHITVECDMDENNKVTYYFYIDGELDVVHHTTEYHDGYNGLAFMQVSSQYLNGVISNFSVTTKGK